MTRQRLTLGLLALLIAIASCILCIGKDAVQTNRMGDAALFEQLIENIHAGKGAVSNVFANTQNFIDHRYIGIPNTELLSRELQGMLVHPAADERSMLGFHAYYILYPISWLMWMMSSSMALVVLQTTAYALLVWATAAYVMVRTRNVVLSVLSCGLVFFSPQVFLGLAGQFYPDRLFVPLGFILLCCLHFQLRWRYVALVALLLALVNERAALISGLLVGMHAILFGWHQRKRLLTQLAVAGLLVAYAFLIKKLVLTNLYYDTFLPVSWDDLVYRYTQIPGFADNLFINLKNNALLLMLAVFAPRYLLIALVVLLPNLVGSIGGAEKVGWLSHYHSYYFPVLCFAAASGVCNLYLLCSRATLKGALVAGFALASTFVWYTQEKLNWNMIAVPSSVMREFVAMYQANRRGTPTGYDTRRLINAEFAAGSLVVTNEAGMAMLHQRVKVGVYPLGLRKADYVYIDCGELDGKLPDDANWVAGKPVSTVLEQQFGFTFHEIAHVPGHCVGVRNTPKRPA
ncbi:MAG: DUF2079 domain-containing protein [Herbaspirillum huttiense]|uniref:DUF2079 domain-containing protein n=1 Tax=Herbaspirillum huttiense TaxID=863372 RepID=UPI001AC921A8|nr:DUF2079 domain-containing protein [Herbaspirillum huttiense]MBN9355080.1 DUF2079 domain-containing protein [Herbaspirillum huttiense]